jgi:hypothetical protein
MEEFTQVLVEDRMEESMGVFMEAFLGRRMAEGWLLVGAMERHLEEDMDIYEDIFSEVSEIGCMDKGVIRSICGDVMR